ncbi:MAG TPA: GNAT family N-acetyltransferase [Acidimicrobiales bacterium]
MDFDLRPVTREEVPAFLRCSEGAFGVQLDDEAVEVEAAGVEADRTLAVLDGKDIVATAGAFSFELTMPGLVMAPAAGVSYVGVQPTHRRLGLLRAMMRRQLDDVRERGEALAVLMASEGGIYGRFGYGPATFVATYEIDRPAGLARGPEGTIHLVSGEVAAGAFPAVYDDARRRQPGEVGRSQPWWDSFFHDHEARRSGAGPLFHAVRAGPGGGLDGYVSYRFDRRGEGGDLDRALVQVEELCAASPAAYVDLWAFVCEIDLTRGAQLSARRLDEPARWLLQNPRRLRLTGMQDHLWVRLVDLAAALEARRYPVEGSLVLEVDDPFCPWNEGTWRLEAGPSGAEARSVSGHDADISLGPRELGSTLLGGLTFSEQVRSGRVVERVAGAATRADAMFGCDPPPFCATEF